MEDKKKELKTKKRFFHEIYSLDHSETDDEDLDKVPLRLEELRKESVSRIPAHRRGQFQSHLAANEKTSFPVASPRVQVPRSFHAEDQPEKDDENPEVNASSIQNSRKKPTSVTSTHGRPRDKSRFVEEFGQTGPKAMVPSSGDVGDESETEDEISTPLSGTVQASKGGMVSATASEENGKHEPLKEKPISVITSARRSRAESWLTRGTSRVLLSPRASSRVLVPHPGTIVVDDDSSTASEIEDTITGKVGPMIKLRKKLVSVIAPEEKVQFASRMPMTMARTVSSPLPVSNFPEIPSDVIVVDDASTTEDDLPKNSVLRPKVTRKSSRSGITPNKKDRAPHGLPTTMERSLSSPLPLLRGSKPRPSSTNIITGTPIVSVSNHGARFASELLSENKLRNLPRTSLPGQEIGKPKVDQAAKRAAAKEARKRKRDQPLPPKPVSQQIFRVFLPNDTVCSIRHSRIKKAQQYGAIRVENWYTGMTHVICDMRFTYNDVIKYFKLSSWPANVILVNTLYLSDCIDSGFLVDSSQPKYRLNGQYGVPVTPQTLILTSPRSDLSVASPPPKRGKVRALTETPPRPEGKAERAAGRELEVLERKHAERCATEANCIQSKKKDALDEAIQEAADVHGLPMDLSDEDDMSRSFIEHDNDSDVEKLGRTSTLSGVPTEKSNKHTWQGTFSCMHKHDGLNMQDNPNARTIEILQKMVDYYDRTKDQWRAVAYRKAISSLRQQTLKITTKAQAQALPFIGARLADKIEEIVWTDRLRRLDNATVDNPEDVVLQLFLGIYGVGFAQAQKWISQGHKTLASLSDSAALTRTQQIGIEHYEDFQMRIPRSEVMKHAAFLRAHLEAVCPDIEMTVGGSYRRGAFDCGDIDFILTSPTTSIAALRNLFSNTLLPRLFAVRYLRAALAETDPVKGTKWHGAACLSSAKVQTWRRVDILLVPWEEMGAALIYFTGNDLFNRSIRLLASKKGMRLNQHGLFKDVLRGPGRQQLTDGMLVEARSEKAIFSHLGVPWRPPEHRIV